MNIPDYIPEGQEHLYPQLRAGASLLDYIPDEPVPIPLPLVQVDEEPTNTILDLKEVQEALKSDAEETFGVAPDTNPELGTGWFCSACKGTFKNKFALLGHQRGCAALKLQAAEKAEKLEASAKKAAAEEAALEAFEKNPDAKVPAGFRRVED